MTKTTALVAAWGVVLAASECVNTTYQLPVDWKDGTRAAPAFLEVDSNSNLFFAVEGRHQSSGIDPSVWVCPENSECISLASPDEPWVAPKIVRVHHADNVSKETTEGRLMVVDNDLIKYCQWGGNLSEAKVSMSCVVIYESFSNIRDMKWAEPKLYIVAEDSGGRNGVWQCTPPHADCEIIHTLQCRNCVTNLQTDFHGNIMFVDFTVKDPEHRFQCNEAGTCSDVTNVTAPCLPLVAVGPDDYWYCIDRSTRSPGGPSGPGDYHFQRCSPDNTCVDLGEERLYRMLQIDKLGALYADQPIMEQEGRHSPNWNEVHHLRKICLPELAPMPDPDSALIV